MAMIKDAFTATVCRKIINNAFVARNLPAIAKSENPFDRLSIGARRASGGREGPEPELWRCLYIFVDACQEVRIAAEKEFGREFWRDAGLCVKDNGSAAAYLRLFRRLVRSERDDAVAALVRLRTRGLKYELPDRSWARDYPTDHGVERLAAVIDVAVHLARQQLSDKCHRISGDDAKIVMELVDEGLRFFLKDGCFVQSTVVVGNVMRLVQTLHSADYKKVSARSTNNRSDEYLWDAIWKTEPYRQGPNSAVDDRLRQLIRLANKKLSEAFGVPRSFRWFCRAHQAYQLTSRVKWVWLAMTPFYQQEFYVDPRNLDRRAADSIDT
jgi:hypothetical protein